MNNDADFQVQQDTASSNRRPVQRFKVTIGGESYFLVSDEQEEHVRAVARLVDEQIRAIGNTGLTDDPKRIAVLVALQCASKMAAAQRDIEQYQLQNDKLLSLVAEELSRLSAA